MRMRVKKIIKIIVVSLCAIFIILKTVAKKVKGDSIYDNLPEEKNPMEGKKVVFVECESDEENADGVKGHLEEVENSDYQPGFYARYVKRAIDVILSFAGLVILSPLFMVIAIAIKIEDPGPVFFTQKRLGQNKRYFKLHKFRSMKMSTPHDVPTHMLDQPEQYITKVGKFIRTHSLDELPQIWDIFVGNLSTIGPRPSLWNQDLLIAERDKYGANDVNFTKKVINKMKKYEAQGLGKLPICIAKTQYSLSDDPTLLGRPSGFVVKINDLIPNTGAGFLVAISGDIMRMPGLPKQPAAVNMDIDEDGKIVGLF